MNLTKIRKFSKDSKFTRKEKKLHFNEYTIEQGIKSCKQTKTMSTKHETYTSIKFVQKKKVTNRL